MPRSCCIVGCKTGSKSNHNTIKASTFSFPTDENLKKKWMDKIPQKDLIVTKNSGVCASHFTDDQIIRTWTSGVGDKQVCINLKYPKLKEDAIPRIFPGPKYLLNPQTERRAPRKRDSSLISSKNIKVVEAESKISGHPCIFCPARERAARLPKSVRFRASPWLPSLVSPPGPPIDRQLSSSTVGLYAQTRRVLSLDRV